MEDLTDNKIELRMEKDQQKLNEKVAGLNEQEELLRDAQEQKKKVNTGWLSNKLQQGLKYIGLADRDFMNLESTISGVNNQIIKLQAGGNVTAGEANRMRQQLADLSMDDEEFDIKLGRVMHQIHVKKQQAAGEYQRKPGGTVRDAAPISKRVVNEVEGGGTEKPPPPAPTGTPKGATRTNNKTRRTWTWNGTAWE